jgi:probable phosphoglycerate mutase
MATAELLLVRHGQSTWNAEGRWQGWADPPLSELGEEQARDAVERLRGAGLSAVASSDLQRATQTAELLREGLGIAAAVEVEPDLRERRLGAFQGLTITEILERWPELFDETGRLRGAPPDAEPVDDLIGRVVPALQRVARAHPGERVLVVAHGGVVRMLERHLGISPPPVTPNLGGRWLEVCDGGPIVAGEPLLPVEREHVTAPRTD